MVAIDSIKIKRVVDNNPDTSWLGKYTDELEPGIIVRTLGEFYEKLPAPMERDTDGRFCRKGEPDDIPARGREYRGFKPYAGGEKPGSRHFYRYGMQDFKRMEGLNNGDWCFIGIQAKAIVRHPIAGNSFRLDDLSSGGLWGIESDSGQSYLKSVAEDELADLKSHLEAFNVDLTDFDQKAAEALQAFEEDL